MSLVEIDRRDGVAIIRMSRPKSNALNREMVGEIDAALREIETDTTVRAIVLTSDCPDFFSAGFDVNDVFAYDRAEMRAFWLDFSNLYLKLHGFPIPVVGALPGHTFAGGIILAFACDVRIMLAGRYGLAVSGINLGVPLPESAMRLAALAVGIGHARHLFQTGETITPKRAKNIGLVTSLHETPGELLNEAERRARELGAKAPNAYRNIRNMFDDLSGGIPNTVDEAEADRFIDHWFSPEAEKYKARIRAKVND